MKIRASNYHGRKEEETQRGNEENTHTDVGRHAYKFWQKENEGVNGFGIFKVL